jgi:hypothetical protein
MAETVSADELARGGRGQQLSDNVGRLSDRPQRIFDVPLTTSELLYVFCAAAWVHSVESIAATKLVLIDIFILFLTFALIPLELYTNVIWQKVVSLYDGGPAEEVRKDVATSTIDVFRVFCLTMIFFFLAQVISALHKEAIDLQIGRNYVFLMGALLLLNALWNAVLFRNATAGLRGSPYELIFARYREDIRRGRGATLRASEALFDIVISCFQFVNRTMFKFVFPIMGLAYMSLFIFAYADGASSQLHSFDPQYTKLIAFAVGLGSFWLFLLQSGLKLIQVVFVSMMISEVTTARSRRGD